MLSYKKQLLVCRVILVLAVLTVGLGHLLPWRDPWFREIPAPKLGGWDIFYNGLYWPDLQKAMQKGVPDHWVALVTAVFVSVCLVVVALPFLPGVLSRARPLWWIVTGIVGVLMGRIIFVVAEMLTDARSGLFVVMTGLGLATIGLLLIPACGREEKRGVWIRPLLVIPCVALLLCWPWIFRSSVESRKKAVLTSKANDDISLLWWWIVVSTKGDHRLPETEDAWQAFIDLSPKPVAGEKKIQLIKVPIDPWGRAYRYSLRHRILDSVVVIACDGPDRTPNTADDVKRNFEIWR